MKKAILGVVTAVAVFSAGSMGVFAAGCGTGRHHANNARTAIDRTCYYMDADEDGICDYCEEEHGFCLGGDGECYLDADGDGICDNCDTYHKCAGEQNNNAGVSTRRGCHSGSSRRHGCHR